MKTCLGFFFSLWITLLFAQPTTQPNYTTLVQSGESALKNRQYESCLNYYDQAFKIKQTSYLSSLRAAACAFMIQNENRLNFHLDTAFAINWDGCKSVFNSEPEFQFLGNTPFAYLIEQRWQSAFERADIDVALMNELAEIFHLDQVYRQQVMRLDEEGGASASQIDSLWSLQIRADSINTIRICEIIDERGYPGKSMVGPGQASTAFLVIQHAGLEVQEQYLPIITAAAESGELAWSSVAMLIDRVRMRQGKKQIYGSQLTSDSSNGEYYFYPIENPYKIDSIRATVGLQPIQEYADYWNLKWDPDKHLSKTGK